MKRFIDAMEALDDRGIGIGVHYPAMHLFALYRRTRLDTRRATFRIAEDIGARNTLTLPLFPAMTDADVDRVVRGTSSRC